MFSSTWIFNILSYAKFNDQRLVKRFGLILESLAQRPAASIPEASASWAMTKGTYRFLGNSKVSATEIRNSFIGYTSDKVSNHKMILVLNDTTEITYGKPKNTKINGYKKKTKVGGYTSSPDSDGVFLHSALVLGDQQTPEGLLYQKHWVRDNKEYGKSKNCTKRVIEDKETYCWLEVLAATQKNIPESVASLIIGDRASDIYELFIQPRRENCHLLTRSAHNRVINDPNDRYLFDALNKQPLAGTITIKIRTQVNKARIATLEVRFTQVQLKRTSGLKKTYPESILMSIVWAKEISTPVGESSVEWKLLTSLTVDTLETAVQCIKWYAKRWIIERYHYALKSGCQVEDLQLESIENIERALSIYCIIAWRLLYMTYIARNEPDVPCTKVLSDNEWQALWCFTNKAIMPPKNPPSLSEAIRLIAKLGGFLGHKSDGQPGIMTVWKGLRRLDDITETYRIFAEVNTRSSQNFNRQTT